MLLLADSIDYGPEYINNDSFAQFFTRLRQEGCHSPTRSSCIKLFKAIKALSMVAKLGDADWATGNRRLSMEALLKQLNGPDGRLDITGKGYEFSGWYTEIYAFEVAGLISAVGHSFMVSERFFKRFCDDRPEEEIHDHLIEFLHYYSDRVKAEVIKRIQRFDLLDVLLDAAFAERSNIDEDRLNGIHYP